MLLYYIEDPTPTGAGFKAYTPVPEEDASLVQIICSLPAGTVAETAEPVGWWLACGDRDRLPVLDMAPRLESASLEPARKHTVKRTPGNSHRAVWRCVPHREPHPQHNIPAGAFSVGVHSYGQCCPLACRNQRSVQTPACRFHVPRYGRTDLRWPARIHTAKKRSTEGTY